MTKAKLYSEWTAIQKVVLASCVFVSGAASATNLDIPHDQLFGATEWRQFGKQSLSGGDILVLKDGRRMTGRLERIPDLHYPFASVPFHVEDLATVAFGKVNGVAKLQVITKSGENFVGDLPSEKILFSRRIAVAQGDRSVLGDHNNVQYVVAEVDPQDINFLILKDRAISSQASQKKFYHMELRNGDHLAITLEPEEIHLTDGWKNQTLLSDKLVDVVFNGGLQGCIEGDICEEHLGFNFVHDSSLGIRISGQNETVRMPWDLIAELRMNLGDYVINEQEVTLAELYQQSSIDDDVTPQELIDSAKQFLGINEDPLDDSVDEALLTQQFVRVQLTSRGDSRSERNVDDVIDFMASGDTSDSGEDDDISLADNSGVDDDMVFVSGGRFLVSQSSEIASYDMKIHKVTNILPTANHPSRYVDIPSFYVDKHEVTNAQYALFVKATGYEAPEHWTHGYIPRGMEDEPVVNVTYADAEAYAAWVGKRLPTEVEWEHASGEASQALEAAIVAKQEVMEDQAFSIMSLIASFEPVMAGNQLPQVLTFGRTLNEVTGKVAEWTSTSVVSNVAQKVSRIYRKLTKQQVVRYGFVDGGNDEMPARQRLNRQHRNMNTGFRCVMDVS